MGLSPSFLPWKRLLCIVMVMLCIGVCSVQCVSHYANAHSVILKNSAVLQANRLSNVILPLKSNTNMRYNELFKPKAPNFGNNRGNLVDLFRLSLMKFLLVFIYSLVKNTRDVLIIPSFGVEMTSFLKLFGVLPVTGIITLIYQFLSLYMSNRTIFQLFLLPFSLFFYRFRNSGGNCQIPVGASLFQKSILNLPLSCYYILSDIWGSLFISLLFWRMVDSSLSGYLLDDKLAIAKSWFPILSIIGNLAPIAAGVILTRVNMSNMNNLGKLVGLSSLLLLLLSFLTDDDTKSKEVRQAPTTDQSMSHTSSMIFKYQSMLLLSYSLGISLLDGLFKHSLKIQSNSDASKFQKYLTHNQIMTGLVTCALGLIVSSSSSKSLLPSLLATPIITGLISTPFLLHGGAYFGFAMNVLSKACKYIFFDSSKELVYLYLPPAERNKVKSNVDIIMNRIGKSLSSLIETGLVYYYGSWSGAAGVMSGLFFSSILVWIWSGLNINEIISNIKK